jgi:hypothetical protein
MCIYYLLVDRWCFCDIVFLMPFLLFVVAAASVGGAVSISQSSSIQESIRRLTFRRYHVEGSYQGGISVFTILPSFVFHRYNLVGIHD